MSFLINQLITNDGEAVCIIMERLEAKYDISFPPVLREFYRQHEGQKIELCKFQVNGYWCEVSSIVPLCVGRMTFERITDNDREDGFISSLLFPLAMDRGGNLYYWQKDTEKVFLLLSDDIENPFLVANSIQAFFDLLEQATE